MALQVSDLVLDSSLETTFLPDADQVRHTRNVLGTSTRRRLIQTEETWQRKRRLGGGTYGTVWLEECVSGPPMGTLRAVKEIAKDDSLTLATYHRELETIAKFSKDKYLHCFVQSSGWFSNEAAIFIAMEYIVHGDLQKYLHKCLPEAEARQITYQVVEAVQFMHGNGFAHRDIKPGNVLVFRPGPAWWIKIGDFGISKRLDGSTVLRTPQIGTRGYVAPEIIGLFCPDDADDPETVSSLSYTTAVDVWSIGEIAVRMITSKPSFPEPRDLYRYVIKDGQFPTADLQAARASPSCCDFIQKMMMASPLKRLNANAALEHMWLSGHEFIDETQTQTNTSAIALDASRLSSVTIDEPSAEWTAIQDPFTESTFLTARLSSTPMQDWAAAQRIPTQRQATTVSQDYRITVSPPGTSSSSDIFPSAKGTTGARETLVSAESIPERTPTPTADPKQPIQQLRHVWPDPGHQGTKSLTDIPFRTIAAPPPDVFTANPSPRVNEAHVQNGRIAVAQPRHISGHPTVHAAAPLVAEVAVNEEERQLSVTSFSRGEVVWDNRTQPPTVKGGSLLALVEHLTRPDELDLDFESTFLLTYRSITTAPELFQLLVDRFSVQLPGGLGQDSLEAWYRVQKMIRSRVIQILNNWLNRYWMENFNDDQSKQLLWIIYEFITKVDISTETPETKALERVVSQRLRGTEAEALRSTTQNSPRPILPSNLTELRLLKIDATELARQLTIAESRLYQKVKPLECLDKAWQKKADKGDQEPAPNIKALILHSNQTTNWVVEMILAQTDAKRRVLVLKYFVSVAERCGDLKNFSTLTSIIAAFGMAPIARLKRTWDQVPRRTLEVLDRMRELMGSKMGFSAYKEALRVTNPPCVPFFAVYLTSLTFIEDAFPPTLKDTGMINFTKRRRIAEVIRDIQQYQNVGYSLLPVAELQDYILRNIQAARDTEDSYNISLQVEPAQREDAKIARLLAESGFL